MRSKSRETSTGRGWPSRVVSRRYWERLNLEQIAERLNVPSGTIKSRLARADRMLVEKLRRIWSEE